MRGEALKGDGRRSPRGNDNKLCRDREKWRVKNTWDCVRWWGDRGRKLSHPRKNNPGVHQFCMQSPPDWVSTPKENLSVTLNGLSLSLHTHHSLQPNYKLSSSLVQPPYWKSIFICLTRPPVFTFRYQKHTAQKGLPFICFPRCCMWISFGRDSNYQLHLNCNQQSPQSPLAHFTTVNCL